MNDNLKKSKERTSLSNVLTQFILTSSILGILINFIWWYHKFTDFLHKNRPSDDNTFIDWLIKDNYQIFIDGSFIISLLISILSWFFVLVIMWIFFRSSDDDLVINKEKILSSEEIAEETPVEEVEEEEAPVVEEAPVEEVEEEEAPVVEEVIIQYDHEEGLTIEEIERDFEKCNMLFANRIYGKRVHRRKIMELERKVEKLKSLGKIPEYYQLY